MHESGNGAFNHTVLPHGDYNRAGYIEENKEMHA